MTREPRYPVLLHGFTGSASSWEAPLLDGLAGAGHAPVLVDLPGHGAEIGGPDPRDFTLEAALARIEAAGRWPADLIGYSLGGRLALHFAAAHPERVRRLVLESASPGLESEAERRERRKADEQLASSIESNGIEWFVDHWESLPIFAGQQGAEGAALVRQREHRLRNHPGSLAAALRALGPGTLPSLWDRIHRIAQPTLVVVGGLDTKFVATAKRMASAMPRARLAVIPDAGHNVHLDAPGAWLDVVVGFLSSDVL